MPQTKEALRNIYGFGQEKIEKYSTEIIETVKAFCEKNKIPE